MNLSAVIFTTLLIAQPAANSVEISRKGADVTTEENSADSLLNRADGIFQARDYQEALDQYRLTYDQAMSEFNRSVEVEASAQMARMYLLLDNQSEGRKWLETAAGRTDDADPMGYSRYLSVKGRYEWKSDDLVAARKTFDGMYTYCTVNSLWGRAIDAANMISIVAETPEDRIKWGQRGIEAAEAAEEGRWLAVLWNNLAGTYYDLKQFDLAVGGYINAREYHWRHSKEVAKLFADYHVGMAYRAQGKHDEAGKWLRPVLAWAERIENHSAIGQACEDLGEIKIAEGEKAEGIKLLNRARDEYKKAGFDKSWPKIWENINNRLKALGAD